MVIGSNLAMENFRQHPTFSKCHTEVKTADGVSQKVVGWIKVDLKFKDKCHPLNLFGIDFWKKFMLIPDVIESIDVIDKSAFNLGISNRPERSQSDSPSENGSESQGKIESYKSGDHFYYLTAKQSQQLQAVISLFPNFEIQGLGRTSLIKHEIDIGNAKPIKQRFYPVSPNVEKLMFNEIDRMLTLGVI